MAASPQHPGTPTTGHRGAESGPRTCERSTSANAIHTPTTGSRAKRAPSVELRARSAAFAVALWLALPGLVHGAGANLAWNACLSEGGTANKDFACTSNTGTNVLYGSFVLAADQPLCTGIEAMVEISAASDSLPAWWQLFNVGACRRASLATSFDFSSDPGTACTDMWLGAGIGGLAAYHTYWTTPQVPSGLANQSRIRFGAAVPAGAPMQLSAGVEYYAFKLMVNNAKSTGATACAECSTPVCLLLSELNVVQSDGQHEVLTTAQTSNRVTWQAATNCPGAMTQQNATWGQIHSILR